MTTDDQEAVEVGRYADGEMNAAERLAFEARLAAEPALQRRLERERHLRAMLGATYASAAEAPAPQRLKDLLQAPAAQVIPISAARRPRWTWQHWGGMAASIALGLVIGRQMLPSAPADGLVAQGELARALDQQLSGQRLGASTPGLSFVARGGAYCRTFTSADSAGLACRDGAGWRLRQLMPAPAGAAGGEYRTAASALPPALLEAVDALREGEVLDAGAEVAARARHWSK